MSEADAFVALVGSLLRRRVRFVVMGVSGANYYADSAGSIFTTEDRDLFLPLDPRNELWAWRTCVGQGLDLWCGDEPLGQPLDLALARQVVQRRALVRVTGQGLAVDLSLVMAGFPFGRVWRTHRVFKVGPVGIPVARLSDIVASKAAAGRPKDRLFLATHEEALRGLLIPKRTAPSARRKAPRR